MHRSHAKTAVLRYAPCRVVVIWIDWYAYHLARFEGLQQAFGREGQASGLELVGGIGVHAGLKFREERPAWLPVETLLPKASWREANKFSLSLALWRRLDELRPEVVLVPGYYTLPAVTAALWARLHRRASVLMTESTAGDHQRTSWKEWLKSRLIRTLFNWAVVGGAAHARYLRQLGMPDECVVRYYDVVGNQAIEESTAALRRTSSREAQQLPRPYFLFVGRLAAEKNVDGLLRAWMEYRRDGGDWPLVLAGDGPEAARLRGMVRNSLFAQDVIFAGLKSAQELHPFFAFAGCFVLPSTREPWGLVVNEAMAAGLPVIVSDRCGCAEDLVDNGRNGLVFDPARGAELTACLTRISALPEEELAAMGQASAEKVAVYSPQNFGRQIALIANARTDRAAHRLNSRPEATT